VKCGVTIPHQTRYTWLLLLSRHGWRNTLRKHSWPARDRSTGVSNPRSNWHSFPEKKTERGEPGLLQRNWALIVLPCRRFVLVAVSYLSDHMSFNGSSSLFWLYWVLGCSFFPTREAASGKEFLLVLHGSSAALKLLVGYFKPVHALNFTMGKSKYLPEDPPPLERPAQANASTVGI